MSTTSYFMTWSGNEGLHIYVNGVRKASQTSPTMKDPGNIPMALHAQFNVEQEAGRGNVHFGQITGK